MCRGACEDQNITRGTEPPERGKAAVPLDLSPRSGRTWRAGRRSRPLHADPLVRTPTPDLHAVGLFDSPDAGASGLQGRVNPRAMSNFVCQSSPHASVIALSMLRAFLLPRIESSRWYLTMSVRSINASGKPRVFSYAKSVSYSSTNRAAALLALGPHLLTMREWMSPLEGVRRLYRATAFTNR